MTGLVVDGLTVHAGGRTIVDDTSFVAPRGAITGLVGPNGAGKSTLMRAAIGLGPRNSGTVHFMGTDLLALSRRDRAQTCAYVEQSVTTEARLNVREVVALGRTPFQPVWQTDAGPEDEAVVEEALSEMELVPFADRQFNTLSGGEQQRVQLARALAQQPKLLVLDEPTSHLDVRAQYDMLARLRNRADTGLTVLLAIHDLNLAAAFCDRIVVLREGRVVGSGAPEAMLSPALLQSVYGIAASVVAHPRTGRPLIAFGA